MSEESGMATSFNFKIRTAQQLEPLTDAERTRLHEIARIYRNAGPVGGDLGKYKYHGVPVTAILEAYNICQLQPDPGFSDDNNYLKNAIAEETHLDIFGVLPEEKVILANGTDATELIRKAEQWLIEYSF